MSASEIVLGLLIERPDTCYRLDKRMAERLGSAQFSRGTAARAVERLLERDYVRPADAGERAGLRVVDGRKKTIFVTTPGGVEHFEGWLGASTQIPPVREELHAKIALCRPADLPRLIEIVRESELACARQLEAQNRRVRAEREAADADEWERALRLIMSSGEVAWWDSRIKWLQAVRMYLEQLREHLQTTPSAGRTRALVR